MRYVGKGSCTLPCWISCPSSCSEGTHTSTTVGEAPVTVGHLHSALCRQGLLHTTLLDCVPIILFRRHSHFDHCWGRPPHSVCLRALQGDPPIQGSRPGREHRGGEGSGKHHHAPVHPRGTAELQDGQRLVITGDALYALRLPSNAAVQVKLCLFGLKAVSRVCG